MSRNLWLLLIVGWVIVASLVLLYAQQIESMIGTYPIDPTVAMKGDCK